jgi:hypothetical protein
MYQTHMCASVIEKLATWDWDSAKTGKGRVELREVVDR